MSQIRSLTSVRFFAAFCIVISHTSAVTGFPFEWMSRVLLIQGVSLFFVLSGFILSVRYSNAGGSTPPGFYVSRFSRIYPAYLLAALTAGVAEWFIYRDGLFQNRSIWFGFLAEIMLLQAWFPNVFPLNGVDWSISTEAFFYLCFPYVRASRKMFWLLLLVSFGFVATAVASAQALHFDTGLGLGSFFRFINPNPMARMAEFLLGVWLGAAYTRRPLSRAQTTVSRLVLWSGAEIMALLLCFGLSHLSYLFTGMPASDAVGGSALQMVVLGSGAAPGFGLLIWVLAHERGLVSIVLRWRVLVALGEASYALYLFHETIFQLFRNYNGLPNYGVLLWPQTVLISIGLFTCMIITAIAVHFAVEQPARWWLRRVLIQHRRVPKAVDMA